MRARSAILAASLLLAGCSAGADMKTAGAAVNQFHQQLDAGQFDAVYANSDPAMKAATTAPDLTNLLAAVHRKLGNTKSASQMGINVNFGTAGEVIRTSYKTEFDNGEAIETFTFRIDQAQAKLVGYNINSNALILK